MIEYIVTDLDGVIRHWDNAKLNRLEKKADTHKQSLFSVAFEKQLLTRVITGEITDLKWRELVREKYQETHNGHCVDEIVDAWINSDYTINKKVLQSYRTYFPKCQLVLLSNATSRLNHDLEEAGIKDAFDYIFNSSELGLMKPCHACYEAVIFTLGCDINELLYIDDSEENIKSARSLGIQSILYKSLEQLEEEFNEYSCKRERL